MEEKKKKRGNPNWSKEEDTQDKKSIVEKEDNSQIQQISKQEDNSEYVSLLQEINEALKTMLLELDPISTIDILKKNNVRKLIINLIEKTNNDN